MLLIDGGVGKWVESDSPGKVGKVDTIAAAPDVLMTSMRNAFDGYAPQGR